MVTEDDLKQSVVCGPDPNQHVEAIERYTDAGYDRVVIHQVGPDQDGAQRFYMDEVLPRLDTSDVRRAG